MSCIITVPKKQRPHLERNMLFQNIFSTISAKTVEHEIFRAKIHLLGIRAESNIKCLSDNGLKTKIDTNLPSHFSVVDTMKHVKSIKHFWPISKKGQHYLCSIITIATIIDFIFCWILMSIFDQFFLQKVDLYLHVEITPNFEWKLIKQSINYIWSDSSEQPKVFIKVKSAVLSISIGWRHLGVLNGPKLCARSVKSVLMLIASWVNVMFWKLIESNKVVCMKAK